MAKEMMTSSKDLRLKRALSGYLAEVDKEMGATKKRKTLDMDVYKIQAPQGMVKAGDLSKVKGVKATMCMYGCTD
eukprot:11216397-Karenia_brevis.AAC.1